MVRFFLVILIIGVLLAGLLGWLWYVAESLETPSEPAEKVIPYDPPRN
ncbi:MAG: hypothetical protein ACFB6R_05980 [Alphaproteobacteria bacterium]